MANGDDIYYRARPTQGNYLKWVVVRITVYPSGQKREEEIIFGDRENMEKCADQLNKGVE